MQETVWNFNSSCVILNKSDYIIWIYITYSRTIKSWISLITSSFFFFFGSLLFKAALLSGISYLLSILDRCFHVIHKFYYTQMISSSTFYYLNNGMGCVLSLVYLVKSILQISYSNKLLEGRFFTRGLI